jgi:hypothetical protein
MAAYFTSPRRSSNPTTPRDSPVVDAPADSVPILKLIRQRVEIHFSSERTLLGARGMVQFGCSCYSSEAVVLSLLKRVSAVQRASVESCGDLPCHS